MRDSRDSKGETLDEMSNSGEREFVESTSSRKTGHQVEGLGCHPTVKTLTHNFFCLKKKKKKNCRDKCGEETMERRFSNQPKLRSSSGEVPRPDTISDAMVCLQIGA